MSSPRARSTVRRANLADRPGPGRVGTATASCAAAAAIVDVLVIITTCGPPCGASRNAHRTTASATSGQRQPHQVAMADRMTPETLHQECHAVHKDVIRLIGEMSPDELRLKALDLQAELEP